MPTEPAVTYQFPCLFGFYLIQKYSFCLLKSLPLTYVHFLWQAVFTHGNSKFQIHQCVSTKGKHTSSAASHKLTERSTRLPVAPGTSDTSNPSTGWQRAVAISREILIFFLMWLSIELQTKVRFRSFPWARPHQSFWWQFTLCHWDSIYTLWFIYVNWMDTITSKWKTLALSLHRTHTLLHFGVILQT